MKKLKIALITGSLSHRGYGVRNAVELLSAGLVKLGHDVMVFGLDDSDWTARERAAWRGAPTQALAFYGPENFGFAPSMVSKVLSFKPDIVHIHGLWMHHSAVAPTIARRSKAKLVVSPHGMIAADVMRYSWLKKRVAMTVFQRACLVAADAFHATSEAERDEIQRVIAAARVEIVPNGLRITERTGRPMDARTNRIIAIGRLHHKKGYDQLLLAWQIIAPEFPNWQLEIRGPSADGYVKKLTALASEIGLERYVIGGSVDEVERDRLVGDSKLFVLPSHNENFALTVPEALFVGTPVLASKGTPWQELETQGCGWWVDNDAKSLSVGLSRALSVDDSVRVRMGDRGQSWVMGAFSEDSCAQAMSQLYTSLASDKYPLSKVSSNLSASTQK